MINRLTSFFPQVKFQIADAESINKTDSEKSAVSRIKGLAICLKILCAPCSVYNLHVHIFIPTSIKSDPNAPQEQPDLKNPHMERELPPPPLPKRKRELPVPPLPRRERELPAPPLPFRPKEGEAAVDSQNAEPSVDHKATDETLSRNSTPSAVDTEIPPPSTLPTPSCEPTTLPPKKILLEQIIKGVFLRKVDPADLPKKKENEFVKMLEQKLDMIERVKQKDELKEGTTPIEEDTSAEW